METDLITQARFDQLEAAIATLPPGEADIVHHFSPGVYCRELRMKPGTVLTGKIHKTKHLNIVCGDITVYNAEENCEIRLTGFHTFTSEPGTRRAGIVHAFTVWITVHPTEETDLEKIEEQVIEKHENPFLAQWRALQ